MKPKKSEVAQGVTIKDEIRRRKVFKVAIWECMQCLRHFDLQKLLRPWLSMLRTQSALNKQNDF